MLYPAPKAAVVTSTVQNLGMHVCLSQDHSCMNMCETSPTCAVLMSTVLEVVATASSGCVYCACSHAWWLYWLCKHQKKLMKASQCRSTRDSTLDHAHRALLPCRVHVLNASIECCHQSCRRAGTELTVHSAAGLMHPKHQGDNCMGGLHSWQVVCEAQRLFESHTPAWLHACAF